MNDVRNIPVILIHKGLQEYLKYTIACAKDHNNRVILIGDNENKSVMAEWYPIEKYKNPLFEKFKEVYFHLSPNSKWFELICFERYFVLLEFMKANKISQCIMLDSDVLLFERSDIICSYQEYEMGGGCEDRYKQVNPCVLYWTISALEEFVSFCLGYYQENEKRHILLDIYRGQKKSNKVKSYGGVSDMVLLYLWMRTTTCKCENFFLDKSDYFIDGNCNYDEQNGTQYKMRIILKIKKIYFKNKIPYIIDPKSKNRKKVLAIHCQGNAKKYINILFKGKRCVLFYYINLLKSILNNN